VSLQPMEVYSGADLHLQPMEDPTPEQADAQRRLWLCGKPVLEQAPGRRERSPCWRRFAGRTCDPLGDPRWSGPFLKDCSPQDGPTLEHFGVNFSLWEGPTLEKFMEDCLLWEGPHAGAREECEESSL